MPCKKPWVHTLLLFCSVHPFFGLNYCDVCDFLSLSLHVAVSGFFSSDIPLSWRGVAFRRRKKHRRERRGLEREREREREMAMGSGDTLVFCFFHREMDVYVCVRGGGLHTQPPAKIGIFHHPSGRPFAKMSHEEQERETTVYPHSLL